MQLLGLLLERLSLSQQRGGVAQQLLSLGANLLQLSLRRSDRGLYLSEFCSGD